MDWKPIETAPKNGVPFLATNGILFGVGEHYRRVEPETIKDLSDWRAYREKIMAPFKPPYYTAHGTFPADYNYLESMRQADEAWEKAKEDADLCSKRTIKTATR